MVETRAFDLNPMQNGRLAFKYSGPGSNVKLKEFTVNWN